MLVRAFSTLARIPPLALYAFCLLSPARPAHALTAYIAPPSDVDLIGYLQEVPAGAEDTLLDIARRHHLGQEEILLANPEVDRWLPGTGTPVVLPTRYILPDAPRQQLVLNVPEMRVYHYLPTDADGSELINTYPVSVGRMDWATPLGVGHIVRKDKSPAWYPPASIRAEAEERGEPLPRVIPPGPDNPLGDFALRLSVPGYLIHGTNKPWGIGMRVTHGCLRMYPEHIEHLFDEVRVGTDIRIVNQPVKVGWLADTLYIEVHPPLEEDIDSREALLQTALEQVRKALGEREATLDGGRLRRAVEEQLGYPVPISRP